MLKLNSSRKLQALLAGAVATIQPACVVGYTDKTSSAFDGDAQLTDLNGATAVDVCAAPAAGAIRQIDYLTLRNADSAAVVATIRINEGGALHSLVEATLAMGEMLGFTHSNGWYVNAADGSRKSSATAAVQWGDVSGTLAAQIDLQAALDAKVPVTRTVNGHALSANVTVTAADVGAPSGSGTSSGSNTGDQDLSSYATSAAVAAGYQPLDSDLTAIAALTTTVYGRAFLALADAAAGRTALGLGTAATTAASAYEVAGAAAAAQAASQPLDSDLTAIAALTTTTFGRAVLALADAAALRTAAGLGTLATQSGTFSGTSSGTNTGDQDLSGYQATTGKDATGGYAGLTLFKINFKNALNTFTSFFTNANTAARTYTFKDADGTVAFTSDITGTNSGTNTGDETGARVATLLHAASAKTLLVDADETTGTDSAASFGLIRTTWANVKAFLKTYNDTLYQTILVSGTSIKTVNSTSLLGSGNISISASPGGSTLQVQYGNAGAFGGMSGTSWDDTNRALTITGATVTTSKPTFSVAQTWNAGAVTFTGELWNITDTASAAGSLFVDYQVASASKFSVSKAGAIATSSGITFNGTTGLTSSSNQFAVSTSDGVMANFGDGQPWIRFMKNVVLGSSTAADRVISGRGSVAAAASITVQGADLTTGQDGLTGLTLSGGAASSNAVTNIKGGNVTIAGGAASSGSASANGGDINLDGGALAGAGTAGNVIVGNTRGNLQVKTHTVNTGLTATAAAAPTVASATTIAPTKAISFVSGTTAIATITPPSPISAGGGQITLIPTGLFTTTTAGNIALATTAVVSKALILTYDVTTTKWYPSY